MHGRRPSKTGKQLAHAQTLTRSAAKRAGANIFGTTHEARPRFASERVVETIPGTNLQYVVPAMPRESAPAPDPEPTQAMKGEGFETSYYNEQRKKRDAPVLDTATGNTYPRVKDAVAGTGVLAATIYYQLKHPGTDARFRYAEAQHAGEAI